MSESDGKPVTVEIDGKPVTVEINEVSANKARCYRCRRMHLIEECEPVIIDLIPFKCCYICSDCVKKWEAQR